MRKTSSIGARFLASTPQTQESSSVETRFLTSATETQGTSSVGTRFLASATELQAIISQRIEASVMVHQCLLQYTAICAEVAQRIIQAFQAGKKVLCFGNGGSAADAQHIAAEFVGRFYLERPALPAQALTVNTSSLTAIGNDYAYDQVFSRQIEAFGQTGDVAIGISTSGNSRNVIEALRAARRKELLTIGMTGQSGGQLKAEVDYCICVPSTDTPRIQEAHILVGHVLSELIEQAIFGDPTAQIS